MVLSLVLSLRAGPSWKRATWKRATWCLIRSGVNAVPKGEEGYLVPRRVRSEAVQSGAVRGRPVSQGVWSDTIPHRFHKTLWNGRDYDPDRERAERRKLEKLIKREAKGAAHELRKDNYFLYEVKQRDKALQEEERAANYGRALAYNSSVL
ncbi:hypothetical protein PTKIN_Ptkin17bG0144200 [Pterospermum kingtungense]